MTVRWGDYELTEIGGEDGKALPVWQRRPRERRVAVNLTGEHEPVVYEVPDAAGLEVHVAERRITAEELAEHMPSGTRSVSIFLVNQRAANEENPDLAYAFQAEIEARSEPGSRARRSRRRRPRACRTSSFR